MSSNNRSKNLKLVLAWTVVTGIAALDLSANTSNGTHAQDVFDSYPPSLLYFAAFCCVLFVTIGVPGNAVTIVALGKSRRVRNATTAFIINLSIADLMLCSVNMPLAISNFLNRGWVHGDFLCELFPLLRYGNVAVSLLSVLVITINRFVMIAHPKYYHRIYRKPGIAAMILSVWAVSFGPLLPTWAGWWGRFGFDRRVGTCTILAVDGRSPKSFLFVLAFVLPCIIIILCYVRIFWIVRGSRAKAQCHRPPSVSDVQATLSTPRLTDPLAAARTQRRPLRNGSEARDLRLLKMILVIFAAFLVCYLPLTIVKVLGKEEDMPVLNILSYVAIYLTSCTNPIVYVVMSREYRKAYMELFRCRNWSQNSGAEISDVSRSLGLTTVR